MASYITVSQLNNYLKRKFDADIHLNKVYLKGEISNFKLHSRGHMYFSIKDDTSVIGAIMFERDARSINFNPADGVKVFAEGRVSVYEGAGKYQIIVNKMIPDGIGALFIKFEKLKKDLAAEGLFDKKYKKPIPKYPKRIGVVTAPTGAAIRDILTTIKRRYKLCEVILFPALVQGENAKESIAKQIEVAQNYDLDVLIVGRGGGSIEDLWAFNEEIVARSIFASTVPIISAVGHEVDFTIADFVADLRAPTPTAAAEICVPNTLDVIKLVDNYKIRMNENIRSKINILNKHLDSLTNNFVLKNPLSMYESREQKLSNLIDRLNNVINQKITLCQQRLDFLLKSHILSNPRDLYTLHITKLNTLINNLNLNLKLNLSKKLVMFNKIKTNYCLNNPLELLKPKQIILDTNINKLELLNPLGILKKGYSVVSIDEKVVKSYKSVKEKDKISIKLSDGKIYAEVIESRKEKWKKKI